MSDKNNGSGQLQSSIITIESEREQVEVRATLPESALLEHRGHGLTQASRLTDHCVRGLDAFELEGVVLLERARQVDGVAQDLDRHSRPGTRQPRTCETTRHRLDAIRKRANPVGSSLAGRV